MKRVFLNKLNENWVVDRFRSEWYEYQSEISENNVRDSDVIWIIAPWTWNKISKRQLKNKKVICTIHHIDEEKFLKKEKENFYSRDKFVDEYHVISNKTKKQVQQYTDKKIHSIPFWVNQNVWFEIKNKEKLRNKYKLDMKKFYIGSFQRDTEGSDLTSPKLSKGPDIFIEKVKLLMENNPNIEVLLAGTRRQYIIGRLKELNIPFKYFEMVDFSILNELYNLLDLYIVSSRFEGGPQAIMECSLLKIPIISTDVGIAKEILSPKSIYSTTSLSEGTPDIDYAIEKVKKYLLPQGMENYKMMLINDS
ncbi:MAG: hypothetical protein CBE33_01295 [Candidatus Pelagibacter sp. TMED273]|nr:MAG: hypothetical protein CBE33_01295 [Candidatus Pelagibacter sp. TMED273]